MRHTFSWLKKEAKFLIRPALLIGVVILVIACAGAGAPGQNVGPGGQTSNVKYVHDDEHKVGIWIWVNSEGRGSISVLADKDYK